MEVEDRNINWRGEVIERVEEHDCVLRKNTLNRWGAL